MKDDFSIKGEVIAALEGVEDPGQGGKNIVDTHLVEQVEVKAGVADITLVMPKGRAREERFTIEDAVYDKVEAIDGVLEVKVKTMTPQALEREQNGEPAPAPSAQPAAAPAARPAAGKASPAAQPQAAPSAPIEGVGKVIAVASGKGGVGKSTVAVNLALALQKIGHRVGLLDVDIYGPSLPTLLGISGRPAVSNRRILPMEADGLRVMSLGFLMDEDTPVIWRGPIVTGIIRQFLRDVDWSGLDYLIVDMPPGTGDAQLALAQTVPVDGAVIVTTPSDLSLIDAARGLQMFKTLNVEVMGIVTNMSKFIVPSTKEEFFIFGNPAEVAKEAERLETPVLGEIPLDLTVREGGDAGRPVVVGQPDSPVTEAFVELATKVAELKPPHADGEGGEGAEQPKKGLFSFLKS
ncbi:Mrp/NBP35 family ATP-binding protein [Lujinxingia vulgaris]|uniref:Iron-sulfur cluster carrier protein n=1 Tax=Lujinxingia vulgaris TaxID=2600176 RepID=A0A5C6X8J6_9DELT|nr:Mrp/NBP35 family ATP-binding protein [Lujinxingia vulgaris]TXD38201.1 Mrp/NBP35 family ATP-binding protein [Lujinxingia vulgaris]